MTAELPGVDEKDIKVSLDQNQLVISGEKKAESHGYVATLRRKPSTLPRKLSAASSTA